MLGDVKMRWIHVHVYLPFETGMLVIDVHAMPRDGGMLDLLQDSIAKLAFRIGQNKCSKGGAAGNRKIAHTNNRQWLVLVKPKGPGAPSATVEVPFALTRHCEECIVAKRLARFHRGCGFGIF